MLYEHKIQTVNTKMTNKTFFQGKQNNHTREKIKRKFIHTLILLPASCLYFCYELLDVI